MPDNTPTKTGGHLIQRTHRERNSDRHEYRCQWCGTTGPYGLFDVIGQLDYCPANIESMNGYLLADPSYTGQQRGVLAEKCALLWREHARRAAYAVEDFQFVEGDPVICATFTWHERRYRLRYGLDHARGMKTPGAIHAEPVEDAGLTHA